MRVLVTGASGMLGRATATALLERGDDVTVLQRRPAGLPCREVLGDVADPAAVGRAVEGQDAVLHLAAKVDVTGPWAEYLTANVDGTRTVVGACRSAGVEVAAVLTAAALPVDIRHQSKVDRGEVARRAARVLAGGRAPRRR